MILADSSAWIAFLRGEPGVARDRVRELVGTGSLATTEVVTMEVLAGARDGHHLKQLRALLSGNEHLAISPLDDYDAAAQLYRAGRSAGVTPRQLNDCLIAAVALRHDVPLLHADRDFEQLTRVCPLRTIS